MDREHSLAPWEARSSNVFAADGLRIAMVDGTYGSEIEANACLMAAAPILLEALEEIKRNCEPWKMADNMACRLWEIADRAVRKADGI